MRRMIAILTALILLCLSGCMGTEELPKGVCTHGDKEYYRIMLPSGRKVDDQFELTGNRYTVMVSAFSGDLVHEGDAVVYFKEVVQGGWVAYSENETGLVLYFPSSFEVGGVQLACTALTRSKENYMSWDQAKNYIQWME